MRPSGPSFGATLSSVIEGVRHINLERVRCCHALRMMREAHECLGPVKICADQFPMVEIQKETNISMTLDNHDSVSKENLRAQYAYPRDRTT
jgi:hypothetical protein